MASKYTLPKYLGKESQDFFNRQNIDAAKMNNLVNAADGMSHKQTGAQVVHSVEGIYNGKTELPAAARGPLRSGIKAEVASRGDDMNSEERDFFNSAADALDSGSAGQWLNQNDRTGHREPCGWKDGDPLPCPYCGSVHAGGPSR